MYNMQYVNQKVFKNIIRETAVNHAINKPYFQLNELKHVKAIMQTALHTLELFME